MSHVRYALLSVYEKEGIVELAQTLLSYGYQLISSGGTATLLKKNNIPVQSITDYTGAPELLDGRVKTLHPTVFAGILARPTVQHLEQLMEHHISPIDMVVVNLYPFEKTLSNPGVTHEEIIEMIDIGGPSLIRAAGKNYERVTVVVDPQDYSLLTEELKVEDGMIGINMRKKLAARAFSHIATYDACIADFFLQEELPFPEEMTIRMKRIQPLRYGENPHQRAALYQTTSTVLGATNPSIISCEQLHGKELSYNNMLDSDAALGLVLELPEHGVCLIKHTNPCGVGCSEKDMVEAFHKAHATDPVSAFGGILACNTPVTLAMAEELKELFLEVVIAPGYEDAAQTMLSKKKNLRLLRYPKLNRRQLGLQLRGVSGGVLLQDMDGGADDLSQAKVVTKRAPTAHEMSALAFAGKVCKHVKSNAIVFANDGQLVGVGAGQMSRVDSVKLAVQKAQLPVKGTVLASDAFFPFRDGLDIAAAAGITAVVQPGGSIRDAEVIEAANEHNLAMIFSGVRHFRH